MGDDLVMAVTETLQTVGRANGIAPGQVDAIVDAIVNRLRGYFEDDEIRDMLVEY